MNKHKSFRKPDVTLSLPVRLVLTKAETRHSQLRVVFRVVEVGYSSEAVAVPWSERRQRTRLNARVAGRESFQ